jgi:hypothetical protein
MANIYKPPTPLDETTPRRNIFLAGSIEMGAAEDWQVTLEEKLSDLDIDIYNPRRDNWDPTLEQKADNPPFREQVEWELNALDLVDYIVMYLSPGTISPISLLELGLYAESCKLIVCCPEGFHRKGNVDIVCERYNIKQVGSLDEVVSHIKQHWWFQ